MQSLNNSLTLLWTWLLNAIGIVTQQPFIYTRCTRYGRKTGILFTRTDKSCRIHVIVKFIVTITQPFSHFIAISYHSLNMEM